MSYDDRVGGQEVAPVLSEVDKIQHQKALEQYRADAQVLLDEIAESQKTLDLLEVNIASKQKELSDLAAVKVDSLNDRIAILEEEAMDKNTHLSDLDKEIEDKTAQRDSILLTFSDREQVLATRESQLNEGSARLAEMQTANLAGADQLKKDKDAFEKDQANFESTKLFNANEIALREATLKADADRVEKNIELSHQLIDELNAKQATVDQGQADLKVALEKAQPLLDQASVVEQQKKDLALKIDDQNARERQLAEDVAQVKTTQIALANREAQVKQRETMVALAEKKIGG